MKFSCTKENIKNALDRVAHVAGKNNNLPILSNIYIKAADTVITLAATDLEIGITTQTRGKVEKEGEFTVQAKLFSDYISLLPNDRIDFELQGEILTISCNTYKTKMKGESAEDYPVIPKIENAPHIQIESAIFQEALSEVLFAAAAEETRIELSGVYCHINGNTVTLAATDSYRLTERVIKIAGEVESKGIIIPVKTLQEVLRFNSAGYPGEEGKEISLYLTDNQVMFTYNTTTLTSRIIEGRYPDYHQIIPSAQQQKTKAVVSRQEFVRAIKASSLFSQNSINDIHLDFPHEQKAVVISALNSKNGESTITVSAEVEGNDNGVVINYRYILDGLSHIKDDVVVFEMIDADSPCTIRAEGRNDYLYIVMPIKK